MARTLGLAIVAATASACSDPALEVQLRFADGLEPRLTSASVSVVAFKDGAAVPCADVVYGRVSADTLAGARRSSVSALEGGARLTGVPRLGSKLILVEGRGETDRVIAAGCVQLGDIAEDTAVVVPVEIVPRVRLFEDAQGALKLLAQRPWDAAASDTGLGGLALEVELRGGVDTARPPAPVTTEPTGVATIPPLTLADLGPQQLVVRVPWTAPIYLPGFVPWPFAQVELPAGTALASPWIAPLTAAGTEWFARALVIGADGQPALAQVTVDAERALALAPLWPAPGVAAIAVWRQQTYAIVDGGQWVRLTAAGPVVEAGVPAEGGGRALDMLPLPACSPGQPPEGMLVRRQHAGELVPRWTGYRDLGVEASPTSAAGRAAALLDAAAGVITDVLCVGDERLLVFRVPDLSLHAVFRGRAWSLPVVSAVAGIERRGADGATTSALIGVDATVTGPRAVNFALSPSPAIDAFLTDPVLDVELASSPTALAMTTLYPRPGEASDQPLDLIAALPGFRDTRLQVSLVDRGADGAPLGGWSLTGLSPEIPGADARLRLVDLDGDGADELVVLTSRAVRWFRIH